jgi:hypothetical protein
MCRSRCPLRYGEVVNVPSGHGARMSPRTRPEWTCRAALRAGGCSLPRASLQPRRPSWPPTAAAREEHVRRAIGYVHRQGIRCRRGADGARRATGSGGPTQRLRHHDESHRISGQGPHVSSGSVRSGLGLPVPTGTITGTDQGKSVRGWAQPNLVRGIGNAADVSGTFGATPFALFANLPVDHPGSVTGTIGGHRDHFEVSPTTQHWNFPIVRLTGDYSGPTDLLALIVGAIAYFAA